MAADTANPRGAGKYVGDSRGIEPPSNGDIRHALTRALAVQIARHEGQPFTPAALQERVTALPGRLLHLGDDWWLVGVIHDTIAGQEIEVTCRPPRIRLREVPSRWVEPADPVVMAAPASAPQPASSVARWTFRDIYPMGSPPED